MTQSAQELLIVLDATTERLRREMRRADDSVSDSTRRMNRALARGDAAFRRLGEGARAGTQAAIGALGALGIALGASELVQGAAGVLTRLQEIERTAQGLGITTKAVQELGFTFQQFGVDADEVTEGLAQLADQALGGSDAWAQLGIKVEQLRGLAPDELFRRLAEGVKQTNDPLTRLSAASSLLGEDLAGKLMPLLIQGADGLDRFAAKGDRLGVVLDDKVVKNGAAAAQTFQDLKAKISADFTRAVADNADEFERLGQSLGTIATAGAKATGWFVDFGRAIGEAAARAAGFTTIEDRIADFEDRIQASMATRQRLAATFGANDPRTRQLDAEITKLKELKAAQESLIDFRPAVKPSQQQPMRLGTVNVQGKAPHESASISDGSAITARQRPASVIAGLGTVEEARNRAQAIFEATRTPLERLKTQMQELQQLSAYGFIDDETFQRQSDALKTQIDALNPALQELRSIGQQVGYTLASGFADAIAEGENLGDVFKSLAEDLSTMIIRQLAFNAIKQGLSGTSFGAALGFADGGAFGPSGIIPFAKGGIVNSPTLFKFARGTGLMGEAGPEAILPLERGPGGKLGVRGGGGVTINVHNNGSQSQVSAQGRRGPDGQQVVDVMVEDSFNRLLGSGRFDQSLAANMGVRRPGRF